MLIVQMPVEGMLITPNTPGSKIPSHGIDKYGVEYAIDFIILPNDNFIKKPYKGSVFKYIFTGIPLTDFFSWGQKIYSPVSGEVIEVVNSIEERNPVKMISELQNTRTVTNKYLNNDGGYTLLTGNYVLIKKSQNVFALLAHLKKDSIKVEIGQKINEFEYIGDLGHSGNSTMPHLHMQFMDTSDFSVAKGLPFVFKEYEQKKKGKWIIVRNNIPKASDMIRYYRK